MTGSIKPLWVAVTCLILVACTIVTFYFLVILKTGLVYTHLFYIPIVFLSAWWHRKGIIMVSALVAFLLICNILCAPDISLINNLVRAAIFLFISVLTSTIFERRKKAEEALRESEERYRDLVEHLNEGLDTVDAEGNLTFVNPRFAEMLGYPPKELISRSIFNFLDREEAGKVREELKKRAKGVSSRYEVTWTAKGGQKVPTLISTAPIYKDGKHVGSYAVSTDLTERKRLEAERLKAVGLVARSIGHDVRNPLQAIRTAAYILRDAEGAKRQEMSELIDRNVVAADRVIGNLRDLTVVPTLNLAEADVTKILREAVAQAVLHEGVKLTTHYGDLPPVKVDGGQLSRVFENLVKNAVEAMPEGGKLEVSTGMADRYIEVKVSDTGVGIPEEKLEEIFRPFYTTKEKGTGLGLVGVKHILEGHGGVIKVESTVGKGTTFTVQIPRKSEG
jgi:two-component system, sporulation sensor kinase E